VAVEGKWGRHFTVVAIIGALVAFVVAVLFSSSHGRGLDGLGAGLAAVGLVMAFLLYTFVSTVLVAFVRDRGDVGFAHAVTLGTLMAALALMIAMK
jgi:hypothetical protein